MDQHLGPGPTNRARSAKQRPETRNPDTAEGIEAARRKWEVRLRQEGRSAEEARRLATAEEVLRRVRAARQRLQEERACWEEEAETAWRRDFKPHAVMLTERERPLNLFWMMLVGDERFIFFEEGTEPERYRDYVLGTLPEETDLFGKPVGYVVNYTPDHAIRFDLSGSKVEELPSAYRPGQAQFRFSNGTFDVRLGQSEGAGKLAKGGVLQLRPAAMPQRIRQVDRRNRMRQREISTTVTKETL